MGPRVAVPEADPSERWGDLLAEAVTPDGFVDYDLIEANRDPLDAYVAWLSHDAILSDKMTGDNHALHLNAYNAFVIYQVLERGKPASVMDVVGRIPVPGSGFFLETAFDLGPDWLSLSEIEHERIRQLELDFRDHAAMNCASRSCPPMRPELYGRGSLQTQLREQFQRWIDDPTRGVRVEEGVAVFSPIFDWYARDFHFWSAGQNLCEMARRYASEQLAGQLKELADAGCPHRFGDYDWSLNDAR
jgi:hypothetical protein